MIEQPKTVSEAVEICMQSKNLGHLMLECSLPLDSSVDVPEGGFLSLKNSTGSGKITLAGNSGLRLFSFNGQVEVEVFGEKSIVVVENSTVQSLKIKASGSSGLEIFLLKSSITSLDISLKDAEASCLRVSDCNGSSWKLELNDAILEVFSCSLGNLEINSDTGSSVFLSSLDGNLKVSVKGGSTLAINSSACQTMIDSEGSSVSVSGSATTISSLAASGSSVAVFSATVASANLSNGSSGVFKNCSSLTCSVSSSKLNVKGCSSGQITCQGSIVVIESCSGINLTSSSSSVRAYESSFSSVTGNDSSFELFRCSAGSVSLSSSSCVGCDLSGNVVCDPSSSCILLNGSGSAVAGTVSIPTGKGVACLVGGSKSHIGASQEILMKGMMLTEDMLQTVTVKAMAQIALQSVGPVALQGSVVGLQGGQITVAGGSGGGTGLKADDNSLELTTNKKLILKSADTLEIKSDKDLNLKGSTINLN